MAFVWLEVLDEKMVGGVLSAVLMFLPRFPPALLVKKKGDFLTQPNPFGAAD